MGSPALNKRAAILSIGWSVRAAQTKLRIEAMSGQVQCVYQITIILLLHWRRTVNINELQSNFTTP